DEAARSVDGVDDPCITRSTLLQAELLTANAVIRERAGDAGTDDCLPRAVGDSHRIVAVSVPTALVGNVERCAEVRQDCLACGDCGSKRELEEIRRAGSGHTERGVSIGRGILDDR